MSEERTRGSQPPPRSAEPPADSKKWDKRDRPGQNGLVPLFGEVAQSLESSGTVGQGSVICSARKTPSEPSPSGTVGGSEGAERAPLLTDELPASPSSRDDPLGYLVDAIGDFTAELLRQGKAESTAISRRQHLSDLAAFLRVLPSPPASLADITTDHLYAFRDHSIARERRMPGGGPLSSRTVSQILASLHGFFRFLLRRGRILLDPALDLEGPRVPKTLPRNVPAARQMRRLLAAPDTRTALGKRDRAILELLYGTGLRSAELRGLLLGDVNLKARTVFVDKGKGGKDRIVPLGKCAASAITDYLTIYDQLSRGRKPESRLPLFLTTRGRRLSKDALGGLLEKHLLRAGLSSLNASPHSLRHACATHLLRGGADIRQIQALLGHASIASTQIYTKVETSDLKRMLDRHHPRSWEEGE